MATDLFPLYINGELVESDTVVDVINPATEEVVGRISAASEAQVDAALEAADAAFPSWSTLPGAERADWMDKLRAAVVDNADELRSLVQLEMGKPFDAAHEDYTMLLDSLEYYAGLARNLDSDFIEDRDGTHTHEIVREPLGVVGAFLAWNFPLLNLAYKIGPAMAAGCPILIKPSTQTPLSAYAVGRLCAEIGLPAGVVNILGGSNATIGDRVSASTIPAMLTLIGSTNTGIHIMKTGATSIKRYSMELGGNAPALVFADADIDHAADIIAALKFGNSGQICVTPNRVFAEAPVYEELTRKIVERAEKIKVGYGDDRSINMGPLIDQRSCDRLERIVRDAVSEGAELLTGGARPPELNKGAFLAPTVLAGVTPDMEAAHEELFGPVVSMMAPIGGEAEMIAEGNNTDMGLTSYVFTSDAEKADRCARALRFGEVQVNGVKYAINLPHGGFKQSGIGVDCSEHALDEHFAIKRISKAIS